jgi:hypothetical protein
LIGNYSLITLYSAKTAEVCKILPVKISNVPKVIFFTHKNTAYLYDGDIKADLLLKNFISDDFGFEKHPIFTDDV